MTTVVYDKNILAADSRTTHGHTEHTCVVCDNKSRRYSDKSNKIHVDFKDVAFRGQKVLAVAGAGVVSGTADLIAALRMEEGMERAYKIYRSVSVSNPNPSTLMIVAEKSVFVVEEEPSAPKELTVREHKRTERVAIGSGAKAALMALELTDCGAQSAIRMTMAVDDATGGPVTYVDVSKEGELSTEKYGFASPEEVVKSHRRRYVEGMKAENLEYERQKATRTETPVVKPPRAAVKKQVAKRTTKATKK